MHTPNSVINQLKRSACVDCINDGMQCKPILQTRKWLQYTVFSCAVVAPFAIPQFFRLLKGPLNAPINAYVLATGGMSYWGVRLLSQARPPFKIEDRHVNEDMENQVFYGMFQPEISFNQTEQINLEVRETVLELKGLEIKRTSRCLPVSLPAALSLALLSAVLVKIGRTSMSHLLQSSAMSLILFRSWRVRYEQTLVAQEAVLENYVDHLLQGAICHQLLTQTRLDDALELNPIREVILPKATPAVVKQFVQKAPFVTHLRIVGMVSDQTLTQLQALETLDLLVITSSSDARGSFVKSLPKQLCRLELPRLTCAVNQEEGPSCLERMVVGQLDPKAFPWVQAHVQVLKMRDITKLSVDQLQSLFSETLSTIVVSREQLLHHQDSSWQETLTCMSGKWVALRRVANETDFHFSLTPIDR